jgi:glycosyltransferase involved in cell wall biosynthesis
VGSFINEATSTLRRLCPDRIEAHWLVPSAWPVAWLQKACQVTAVAHGGDVRLLLGMPTAARHAIMQALYAKGVRLRMVSHTSRDQLLGGLSTEAAKQWRRRCWVEPIALELPDVSRRASMLREEHGPEPIVVTVSRLVALKRVRLAVSAAQQLDGRVAWHVIGDGPELERLKRLDVRRRVKFHGQLTWHQTLAWLEAANVLVHTSGAEAAPTAVREARALATPVVACDAGDVRLWAQTDPGITVVRASARTIADAVATTVSGNVPSSRKPDFSRRLV